MFWTHVYDLLIKFSVLSLSIIFLISIPFFENKGILVGLLSLVISILSYILFLRTTGSYLYCRLALKMGIIFNQAKNLNAAIAPSPSQFSNFNWLPLTEVKYLEEDKKYETALSLLNNWELEKATHKSKEIEKFNNNSLAIKILDIISIIIVFASFFTTVFQLPPATFLIKFYCNFFNTEKYSVTLISVIMIIIVLLPLLPLRKLIDKSANK